MTDFSDITHLLFDHDGVLVDTEYWYFLATQRELAELNIEITIQDYLQQLVTGESPYAHLLPADETDAFVMRRNRRYEIFLTSQDIQIPGVENTLAALRTKYPMAIVTSSLREHFDLIHEQRNIKEFFEFVIARGDYEHAKPAPDSYLTALEEFEIEPHQALVIEDSARGLASALATGIRCVIVKNEFTATQDFSSATAKIDHIADLPGLLGFRMPGLHAD